MERVVPVESPDQIFPQYRDTPIGRLLEYHNLQRTFESYTQAELLIGMCMDHREHLHIPGKFAYILRAGGANLRQPLRAWLMSRLQTRWAGCAISP